MKSACKSSRNSNSNFRSLSTLSDMQRAIPTEVDKLEQHITLPETMRGTISKACTCVYRSFCVPSWRSECRTILLDTYVIAAHRHKGSLGRKTAKLQSENVLQSPVVAAIVFLFLIDVPLYINWCV